MPEFTTTRRDFIKKGSLAAGGAFIPSIFHIGQSKPKLDETILGHGDFQYRVHKEWGDLDPENTPVKNCHEMVMDSKGRLIMITDDTRNNIIIYDINPGSSWIPGEISFRVDTDLQFLMKEEKTFCSLPITVSVKFLKQLWMVAC